MVKKHNKRNVRKNTKKESDFSGFATKLRRSMKWALGLVAGVSLTLSLVFIGFWLVGVETGNWFPLNRLEVNGQKYTQASELYESLSRIEERGFFSMDMQKAEKDITALPWVKSVQLRKIWPETLSIHLVEHSPLAYWGEKGVVSKECDVFYPVQLPEAEWVKLEGPEVVASELTELLQMYQQQLAQKKLTVASISLTERGAVNLKLDDGIEVRLGNYQVAERLGRFLEQFDNLSGYKKETLAYVDLRYQNGLVAAWSDSDSNQADLINGNSNR